MSRGVSLRSPAFLVVIGAVLGVFIAAVFIPIRQPEKVTVGQVAQTAGTAAGALRADQTDQAVAAADDTATTAPSSVGTVTAASAGPSTPAGGGTAAASGAGATAAAQPSSTAAVRGVTDNSIKIGISVFDVSAFKYLGPNVADVGNIQQQWEAIFDDWHRRGVLPMNGRDITPVFHTHQVSATGDTTSQRSTCSAFVNDDKVFAVIGTSDYATGADCVAGESHFPIIVDGGITEAGMARNGPYLFSLMMTYSRLLRNFVHWADANHFLSGHKIGLYAMNDAETTSEMDKSVKQELAKMGDKLTAEAYTDNNQAGSQDALAVQRFQALGVDTVMLFASAGGFTNQAKSQGYHPQYITTDFNLMTADSTGSLAPADQFDGMRAMTGRRDGEGVDGTKEDAQQEACLANYERYSGHQIPRHKANTADTLEYRMTLTTCDEANALLQGLKLAGRDLTPASFIKALESITGLQQNAYAPATFKAGKHDGADQQRTLLAKSSCSCWAAITPLGPLFVP